MGDMHAKTSVNDQNEILFFLENTKDDITMPIKPPWNDIPPFQTFAISAKFDK